MSPGDPRFRFLYLIWSWLECVGFGGLIYGWGSLVYILKDEGLYLDLCDGYNFTDTTTTAASGDTDDPSRSCPARDAKLALVFTIGSGVFAAMTFAIGQINYRFGTRTTRLVGIVLFLTGALLIAFTSNDVPWLIFPGLSLVGAGGMGLFMTVMQISLLFPSRGSLVVGSISGMYDASSGTVLLVKLGFQGGISRSTSFVIIACTSLLTLISTFFFFPKDFIVKPDNALENTVPPDTTTQQRDQGESVNSCPPTKTPESNDESASPFTRVSLRACLLSPVYILHVFWLAILQLKWFFFLSSINRIMTDKLDSKSEVSHFTNVLMYLLIGGFLVSPIAGIMYDYHIKQFKDSRSKGRRSVMPAVIPLAFTTTVCLVWSVTITLGSPSMFYLTFALVVVFRSFLYTLAAGYVSSIFPNEYYGILYGIQLICAGIVGFLQYAVFEWAEVSGFDRVNLYLLVPVAATYIQPLYQWMLCRREERRALQFGQENGKENGVDSSDKLHTRHINNKWKN